MNPGKQYLIVIGVAIGIALLGTLIKIIFGG